MQNDDVYTERRQYKRVVFSASDNVLGEFKLSGDSDEVISVKILDLSAGGLRFALPRDACGDIDVGYNLFLQYIKGISRLEFVSRMELEVRWILDNPAFENVMIGCEFLSVSGTVRNQIDQFVETEATQKYNNS